MELLCRTKRLTMITVILLFLAVAVFPRGVVAVEVKNIVADSGFEVQSSSPWYIQSALDNGTVIVHDNTTSHNGSHSARLSALNSTLQCSTECKDVVRAVVEQSLTRPPPLANLADTSQSLSAWWYVAPSSLPTYSIH